MKQVVIKELTDREHIYKRPSLYIGAISHVKSNEFILENDKFVHQEVDYIGGLLKIFNEIIDNSLDEAIKSNFEHSNEISIKMDKTSFTCKDNGRGIPTDKNENGIPLPRVCWGSAKSGSNFDDDDSRTSIGLNGVGSYLSVVFSKKFTGETDDGKNKYTIRFKDNGKSFKENYSPSKSRGTYVKFFPDLEKFNIEEIDDIHINLIKQRLIHLAVSFPKITFKFNSRKIKCSSGKKYLSYYGDNFEFSETDDFLIGVFPNESDDFRFNCLCNGLHLKEGGNGLDIVSSTIVSRIRKKLSKKFKDLKPGDVKNKLQFITIFKNFKNPMFNSQTKEKLTNSTKDINNYLKDWDYELLAKKLLKRPYITEPIIEIFQMKKDLADKKALKNLKKAPKKIRNDKYFPAIGKTKNIFIVEGLSAMGGLSSVLGREGNAFFALKGKPLNVISSSIQKFNANKELTGLAQILHNIEFENIVMATDADCIDEKALIYTDKGLKFIKDITLFDKVLTHTNAFKRVLDIIKTIKSKYVEITINGEARKFSENHKLIVVRDGKPQIIFAKDVKNSDLFLIKNNQKYIKKKNTTIENLNLSDYNLVAPSNIEFNEGNIEMYDLTVEDDNTFHYDVNGEKCLTHNCDGDHIKLLMLGFFQKHFNEKLMNGKISSLSTPIMFTSIKNKIKRWFYNIDNFDGLRTGEKITYVKGLGGWSKDKLQKVIEKDTLDKMIEPIEVDDIEILFDWLKSDRIDKRKEYIKENEFDLIKL